MTLEEAQGLVRSLRRDMLVASLWRVAAVTLVAIAFGGAIAEDLGDHDGNGLWTAAIFAVLLWILLAVFSARQVRAANQASVFISSGRLDLAEQQLKTAMRRFSLYKSGKLLACHNLAVVAHGQKHYQAAAALCDGVMSLRREASRPSVARLSRILLADCRLSLGESASASEAIAPLSLDDPALNLPERLMLLPIVLRCQTLEGDYQAAGERLSWKVRLAELLEAPKAALVHALLAGACHHLGKVDEAAFLYRRAGLYHDLRELAEEYEILRDSALACQGADNNTDSAP